MAETEREHEARIKFAERIHERDIKGQEVHSKQIEAFSVAAMRAPALVAAGGVAASLGFYSANYDRLSGKPEALHSFNGSLTWIFFGLLLTIVAPGLAYFSQLAYLDSLGERRHIYEPPFSVEGKRSRVGRWIGDTFRWLCVLVVLASIVTVSIGGIKFLTLVGTL